jgi:ankyrin repeat protein
VTDLTREQKEALGRMMIEGAKKGDPDIVRGCLKRGADPDVPVQDSDGGSKKPVLHWMTAHFNEAAAQALVDGGANIEARDADGETALFGAIRAYNASAVEFLMKNGADPLAQSANNTVALDAARRLGTDFQSYRENRDRIIKSLTKDRGPPPERAKKPAANPAPDTQKDIQVLKPISLQPPHKKEGGLGFNL